MQKKVNPRDGQSGGRDGGSGVGGDGSVAQRQEPHSIMDEILDTNRILVDWFPSIASKRKGSIFTKPTPIVDGTTLRHILACKCRTHVTPAWRRNSDNELHVQRARSRQQRQRRRHRLA